MADVLLKNYACHRKFGKSPRMPNYARVMACVRDTYCFKGEVGFINFPHRKLCQKDLMERGLEEKICTLVIVVFLTLLATPINY